MTKVLVGLMICLSLLAYSATYDERHPTKRADGQPKYIKGNSGNDSEREVYYFQDTRTGICFAERGSINDYTMTDVPCEKVQEFLK